MQHKKIIKDEISINALASKVWSVLTQPGYTKQYMFDNAVISECEKGSTITLQSGNDKPPQTNSGNILEAIPGISLRFTMPDPTRTVKEVILTHYELLPEENGLKLISL